MLIDELAHPNTYKNTKNQKAINYMLLFHKNPLLMLKPNARRMGRKTAQRFVGPSACACYAL
jgi:hypothetical protein